MGGNNVTKAEYALHSGAETLKARRSRVRFIAAHHGSPLLGGHGRRTGISEQVDQNGIRGNGEQVVTGLLKQMAAFLRCRAAERFNALNPKRLDDGFVHRGLKVKIEKKKNI